MAMLNQFDTNFPAILFETLYYTYACDAYLGFYSNLKCGTFFLSTRYTTQYPGTGGTLHTSSTDTVPSVTFAAGGY